VTVEGETDPDWGLTEAHSVVNDEVLSVAAVPLVFVVRVATSGVPTACSGTIARRVPEVLVVTVCRRVWPSGTPLLHSTAL
jgi:hypothetical protein